MISLDEAVGVAAAGAKAETLARARRLGIAVPDGFVVLPDEVLAAQEVADALRRLGGERFAVRSSADVEDGATRSAAGVFASFVEVTRDQVLDAIERVRASAFGAPARAYLGSRGVGRVAMAVLVQPMVEATRLGVLHTAGVGEAMQAEERSPDEPEWGRVAPRTVPADEPLAVAAGRLATLVEGGASGADIEYALTADGPRLLQVRPLSARRSRDGAAIDWSTGDETVWQRDATHNPDPLSGAQASLVTWIADLAGVTPARLVHGFLYYSRDRPVARQVVPPAALPSWFAEEIVPACDAALAPLEARPAVELPLDEALAAYRTVAGLYFGFVAPSIERARGHLDQILRANLGEPLAAHGALLAGSGAALVARDALLHRLGVADPAARAPLLDDYNSRFGAFAPAWDVAVACDDEVPLRVLAMAALVARGRPADQRHAEAARLADEAAARLRERLPRMARGAVKHLLPVVRAALAVGESDDGLFFRAQRIVRRALLGRALALHAAGRLDDLGLLFELPIDRLRHDGFDLDSARRARTEREARRRLSPPIEIHAGQPLFHGGGPDGVLRGIGTSGRGYGRAFVLTDPAAAPVRVPPGAVLVLPAILPSLTHLVAGAAGLITDHGGGLSHGATLAREYGVPAVLGTGRACALLEDGEDLIVDGDAGRVYRIR